ncbi:DNA methylase N-4/N-6 domain-containing protein [Halanaeroarchaeum sulfurireducens]|uniref:Type II methyltransferase n=2 Tax=Halanaeroarchaeum sulfurireducens TaxID=1604004 RepID=A0A0F7PB13_9EURY|nr:DNA methylase N-4/N-6 domain-containing protein [Halanaeroarchaeum sulfurireducens]ALG80935.1 DNA methylase N-4/N-6 domain-containing protein [Halanaeroarchaeum sulfurireducens]
MEQAADLGDYIPDSCRDLLTKEANDLRSDIPALARDKKRMGEVDQAVKSLPSHHELYQSDARDLSMIEDESVHLAVTSPPYFDIKDYENGTGGEDQLGDLTNYEKFNQQIDKVWSQVYDKLVPGGRLIVVVGDVLRSRSDYGRHRVLPLHATIQEHCTDIGYDNLAPIIWYKIGNASLEAGGNARFLGKPYEPGAVIKNDIEYILLFRKPGGYRSPSIEERILSVIEADEHQKMFRQLWDDIQGEPQIDHPAPYPVALAQRLIRMFSFAQDTVLDPFAGTGTTAVAASRVGRNSISVELEEKYVDIAEERIQDERGKLTNYENLSVNISR